ncbi:MAG TPA: tetratricopeptide repeat protein, partial [Candidatus Methylacidiphilales bacterium]|nr:tetratricopeptide repeat protein [Candidatus Methylacidiphilales bacterium]
TPDFESAQLNLAHVLQLETLELHNERGLDLMKQHQYKEAVDEFRQVLQYQPDNPTAQENLSQALELEGSPVTTPVK